MGPLSVPKQITLAIGMEYSHFLGLSYMLGEKERTLSIPHMDRGGVGGGLYVIGKMEYCYQNNNKNNNKYLYIGCYGAGACKSSS